MQPKWYIDGFGALTWRRKNFYIRYIGYSPLIGWMRYVLLSRIAQSSTLLLRLDQHCFWLCSWTR